MSYTPTLKKHYFETVRPQLREQFGYTSVMEVPYIEKICLNQGIGKATQDKKLIEISQEQLSLIAGQKAVPRKAKHSISNFKLREGMVVGMRATLRRNRMYEFLDRLINVALPRVRDFRGVSDKAFDGRGNYTLGVKEQIIFPEIDLDKVDEIMGMDINFVTTAETDEESFELLKQMGMPFKNQNN